MTLEKEKSIHLYIDPTNDHAVLCDQFNSKFPLNAHIFNEDDGELPDRLMDPLNWNCLITT